MSLFKQDCPYAEVSQMPVLTLAHVGDGVYELLARTRAISEGECKVGTMHKRCVNMVSAEAQARVAEKIKPHLTETELSVFRRGRNVKPHHAPPHGAFECYALATAVEALFGMLYLTGQERRIAELWSLAVEVFENNE